MNVPNVNDPQLAEYLRDVEDRLRAIEDAQAARDPMIACGISINTPITDGREHVGRLSDVFEHGSKAVDAHKKNILRLKSEIEVQDARGHAGVERHVVLDDSLTGYATPAFI